MQVDMVHCTLLHRAQAVDDGITFLSQGVVQPLIGPFAVPVQTGVVPEPAAGVFRTASRLDPLVAVHERYPAVTEYLFNSSLGGSLLHYLHSRYSQCQWEPSR